MKYLQQIMEVCLKLRTVKHPSHNVAALYLLRDIAFISICRSTLLNHVPLFLFELCKNFPPYPSSLSFPEQNKSAKVSRAPHSCSSSSEQTRYYIMIITPVAYRTAPRRRRRRKKLSGLGRVRARR
jgi:hypothetical protein